MTIYSLTFTIYLQIVKYAVNQMEINPFDLCFFRTTVNFFLAIPIYKKFGKHPINDVPSNRWKYVVLRSIVGLASFNLMVFASEYLPIFILTIVFNT